MDVSAGRSLVKFRKWFFEGAEPSMPEKVHKDAWWKVMCLTGLDYFSTIGFQPGIAFLAAGVLSPMATLILVLVTLFGAYPIYAHVARESPNGQGSFVMLERLLHGWRGKAIILVLLGFASTDFVITMTMCAADAATHFIQNPYCPAWAHHQLMMTLVLLFILASVFLAGFREAIGTAVVLVTSYLVLNAWLLVVCTIELMHNQPGALSNWWHNVRVQYPSYAAMLGISFLVFPRLALGLSGFETGVSVMPHVRGFKNEPPDSKEGCIQNTRLLLMTAALIMCVLLVTSSVVTTALIPAPLFKEGQAANGRAMAYLAHQLCGPLFGSAYDISTIFVLWFAGASTMAAILNLIPRYLPRYGMAPTWAKAMRPLVVVVTVINVIVTLFFKASVDGQAGAFATGLLVLFTSAAFACLLSTWKRGLPSRVSFMAVFLTFTYTTIANMIERTEGLIISLVFVALILSTSLMSRALRTTELRISKVVLDDKAQEFIAWALHHHLGQVRLLAHRPGTKNYAEKVKDARWRHSIQDAEGDFIFVEVELKDVSDFTEDVLYVRGFEEEGARLLRCESLAVPNALAAILLHIRDTTGILPNIYFGWTEGHPLSYVLKYIFLGEGETAPVTREILRSVERDERKRPLVHVG